MFGMGFMEIFLVLIVAIIALGPEKLPTAVVDIAKFFKKLKSGIDDAKSTIDDELNIAQMKQQAQEFKANISNVKDLAQIDLNSINSDRIYKEEEPIITEPKTKKKKKEKISKKIKENKKETISFDQSEI